MTIDSREAAAKTFDGTYIGTVRGSKGEKQVLANKLTEFLERVDHRLAREGVYSQVSIQVEIRNGKLKTSVVTTSDSEIPS